MGQQENNLKSKYHRTLTQYQRLWRCNSGTAWSGAFLNAKQALARFKISIPIILKPLRIKLWPKGTPDEIGFDSIIIAPDMVGKRVAVFVGTEYKAGGKLNPDQVKWRDEIIVPMGGIHREIRPDGSVVESGFNKVH